MTATATREWKGLQIPTSGTFNIDPMHSEFGFVGTHMMFTKVRGQFLDVTGTVELAEDPTQSSIEINVKTPSISTGADPRDGHLRSGDFLDTDNYPEMTYRSTSIRHAGGSEFAVTGDLAIKDVTRPVELTVTFEGTGVNPWGVEVAGVSASGEINREDWGLTWNAPLEAGGVLVGRKVGLAIEIQGARA